MVSGNEIFEFVWRVMCVAAFVVCFVMLIEAKMASPRHMIGHPSYTWEKDANEMRLHIPVAPGGFVTLRFTEPELAQFKLLLEQTEAGQ